MDATRYTQMQADNAVKAAQRALRELAARVEDATEELAKYERDNSGWPRTGGTNGGYALAGNAVEVEIKLTEAYAYLRAVSVIQNG